jgi:Cu+-exporting ATPase
VGVSAAAAIPLIILTMGPMVGLPVRQWLGERMAQFVELVLATPVVLWAARAVLRARVEFSQDTATTTCGR